MNRKWREALGIKMGTKLKRTQSFVCEKHFHPSTLVKKHLLTKTVPEFNLGMEVNAESAENAVFEFVGTESIADISDDEEDNFSLIEVSEEDEKRFSFIEVVEDNEELSCEDRG